MPCNVRLWSDKNLQLWLSKWHLTCIIWNPRHDTKGGIRNNGIVSMQIRKAYMMSTGSWHTTRWLTEMRRDLRPLTEMEIRSWIERNMLTFFIQVYKKIIYASQSCLFSGPSLTEASRVLARGWNGGRGGNVIFRTQEEPMVTTTVRI